MRPSSKQVLVGVVILQAGIMIGMLGGTGEIRRLEPVAGAAGGVAAQNIPDAAGQQIQTNEILRGIDAKLAKMSSLLEAGIKVTPVEKK